MPELLAVFREQRCIDYSVVQSSKVKIYLFGMAFLFKSYEAFYLIHFKQFHQMGGACKVQ